ncbi:Bug family tripartite tricarboxylate transporter substrate binding protein [Achromobacter xylosoxidans]|uniref:Bug family tripartite tricarboxylate transporter substrate binding protein n=1 Tax=Alcaligenes xylosoxydans xylosoxydans TaxID=85698 RepID=UPI00047A1CC5|nr:tripartite tricarboxylate transporter substrate binding protein [Achromobacter xylosoxidans]MCH4595659.1 tripartite tricarboxylate transporter substrate binding protein [Achromobacter xylosoxidans]CUJ66574.1 Argininosuccinate lyase [Achromobacter xylosoxidans]
MHPYAKRLLALATLSLAATAQAQSWPTQPIRWIVPYPAGGGTDVLARTVVSGLEKPLGQTVVVENRPGAATIVGATAIAESAPSGYVLGSADIATLAFNPALYNSLTYDSSKFTYIGGLARFPMMLAVNAGSAYKTLDDVLQAARKHPGKLTASSAGTGSPHHLALELFKQRTGADILHVPYKGAAPAIQDLLGNQVDLMFVDLTSALPNIKAGKLRILATATPQRLKDLPDVPTMAEQGVKDYTVYSWQGVVGPKGLPEAVTKKLSAELQAAIRTPAMTQKMADIGVQPMPMSAEEFRAYTEQERQNWAEVIRKAGIKRE